MNVSLWKKYVLNNITTSELVQEMCKRKGVETHFIPKDDYGYIACGHKNSIKMLGAARILVVKE